MFTIDPAGGASANAALFIALAHKLVEKNLLTKEDLSEIVDDARGRLAQNISGVAVALGLIPKFRKELGLETGGG